MKKISIITIVLLVFLSGCRYEEGPFINFKKVDKRIRGMWDVSTVYKNGKQSDIEFPTEVESLRAQFRFHNNGVLIITYIQNNIIVQSSGSWDFGEKKKTLNVAFKNQYTNTYREYEILKFKSQELKLRFTDEDDVEWMLVFSLYYSMP